MRSAGDTLLYLQIQMANDGPAKGLRKPLLHVNKVIQKLYLKKV